MHKHSDRILLQPKLVFSGNQVNVYDAVNLVAYAREPLVSARRDRDLVAGFVPRNEGRNDAILLSRSLQDELLGNYHADISRLRYPVGPQQYAPLLEKMLDAGEPALPYFYHEHHELVSWHRRVLQVRQNWARIGQLSLEGKLTLQSTESSLAGFPIPSEAWMTQESLRAFLEGEGVLPWWEQGQNLDSHSRITRILMSDWVQLPNGDTPDPIDREQLPSYLFAQMLLKRSPPLARPPYVRNTEGGAPAHGGRARTELVDAGTKKSPTNATVDVAANAVSNGIGNDSQTLPTPDSLPPSDLTQITGSGKQPIEPSRTKITRHASDAEQTVGPEQVAADDERLISKEQIAELLGVSKGTVENRAKTPGFPEKQVFGPTLVRWNRADFMAWMKNSPKGGLKPR